MKSTAGGIVIMTIPMTADRHQLSQAASCLYVQVGTFMTILALLLTVAAGVCAPACVIYTRSPIRKVGG